MKRYEMTTEYNRVGCYDEVIPVESTDGDWIKFSDYQAATEAAKATSVAVGELPALPKPIAQIGRFMDESTDVFDGSQMRAYGLQCEKVGYDSRNEEVDALIVQKWDLEAKLEKAEAARQPAPVVATIIPDWPACNPACDYEDPRGIMHDNRSSHCNCEEAKESICRQRAALAATAAPVLSDALEAMERAKLLPIWDNDVPHKLHVELDIIFKALAATRSQP